jgi:serine protease Do
MAKDVVPDLISHGRVVRGFLGVDDILDIKELVGSNVTVDEVVETLGLPDARGAYVNGGTIADSPAAKAGIVKGDVIRKVNGNPIEGAKDLVNRISKIDPGMKVSLEIWRKGKPEDVSVEIAEFPENVELARFGPDILGMHVRELTTDIKRRLGIDRTVEGLLVVNVEEGSPSHDAELERGDVILEVQQNPVKEVDAFRALIEEHGKPGKAVLLQVLSQGSERSKPVLIKVPEK